MNRLRYLTFFSLIFLFCSVCITKLLDFVTFPKYWIPLVIAFAIVIINGIMCFVLRKTLSDKVYVFAFFNSISLGFSIKSWYLYKGYDYSIWTMLLIGVIAILILFVIYSLKIIPFIKKHTKIFFWILSAILFVGFVILVILVNYSYLSTLGYYLIVVWAFSICIYYGGEGDDFKISTLYASFSILVVAIIILSITSGEFDLDFGGPSDNNKKKNG